MMNSAPPPARPPRAPSWPALVCGLLALVSLLPFAGVDLPSLTDLPGHIGRYHVMLEIDRSEALRRFYAFDWRLVGNLGVDLLVRLIGPLAGVERAAVLTAALIPVLTIGGIAAVSRALHGRVEPSAAVACCFVFSNPYLFGFTNYALSLALALFAFAGWIVLRRRPAAVQLAALTPLVFLTWLSHAMGWGVLALLVAGFEAQTLRRDGAALRRLADAALRCLAFLPPLLLTLLWGGGAGRMTAYGTDLLARKAMAFLVMLRGSDPLLDIGVPAVLALAIALLLWRRRLRVDWRMAAGGLLLALAALVMPTTLFGSWAADERIVPAAAIALSLSLAWRGGRNGALLLAALAASLFALRILSLTQDWRALDRAYASHLRALQHVPRGSRIFALVLDDACARNWRASAYATFPAMAIARRDAFVNSEWRVPGAPLLRVVHAIDPELRYDPSHKVAGFDCAGRIRGPLEARIARLPREGLDYLWLLNSRGDVGPLPGIGAPLFTDSNSALYPLRR